MVVCGVVVFVVWFGGMCWVVSYGVSFIFFVVL